MTNVSFHACSVDDAMLPPSSQDFGYALVVLHPGPAAEQAVGACVAMLKPGAPFLVYLYYAFDNRSPAFRARWQMSDILRRGICRLPPAAKHVVTDMLALLVYLPLATLCRVGAALGANVARIPLSYYRKASFFTMRTDSLDRFGTPMERRFTRTQIRDMLAAAGLERIVFSEREPYWCAVGYRR